MRRFFLILLAICLAPALPAGELLTNGGFESDADGDGFPDDWVRQRRAVIDEDPASAFQGAVSVKAASYHSYIQDAPINGGTRLFASGFMKGDAGAETAALRVLFRVGGAFPFQPARYHQVSTDFTLYGASFYAPPGADLARFVFNARWFGAWIRGDGFSMVDEFMHNPDFENLTDGSPGGWRESGHPDVNASGFTAFHGDAEVRGDGESFFYQELAVDSFKRYVLIFHVRSEDAGITPEALSLKFFDRDLSPLEERLVSFDASLSYRRVEARFTPPEGAALMRLELRPALDARSALWFDALGWSAAAASPQGFSPNGDGVYDESRAAILTNENVTATVRILDQAGSETRTLAENAPLSPGAHFFSWDGSGSRGDAAPPGLYEYECVLEGGLGGPVTLRAPASLSGADALSSATADFGDFFPRGLWLHLGGRFMEDLDYRAHLESVKSYGFNTIIPIWYPENRREELMDVADELDLKVIAHAQNLNAVIGEKPDHALQPVGEARLRDEVATAVMRLSDHPSLLGYYVRDEVKSFHWEATRDVVRILKDADPARPAFSSIGTFSGLEDAFRAMELEVLLHHHYPFIYADPVSPNIFNAYRDDLNRAYDLAENEGAPLWMILQGYSIEGARRFPTTAEMRCQAWLALAHGAKGVFYFVAGSFFNIRGLYDMNQEPSSQLDVAGEINAVLEKTGPRLLTLSRMTEGFATVAPDHEAGCFRDPSDGLYVICVNMDCLTTRSSELVLDLDGVSELTDAVSGESLYFYERAGFFRVPLELAPGDGTFLKIQRDGKGGVVPAPGIKTASPESFSFPHLRPGGRLAGTRVPEADDPAMAGFVALDENLSRLAASAERSFAGVRNGNLYSFETRRPWKAALSGVLEDPRGLYFRDGLFAGEDNLYVSDPSGGLHIYETPDGAFAKRGEWWGLTGSPLNAVVRNGEAFMASDYYGLVRLNVTDPADPFLFSRGEFTGNARDLLLKDDVCYLLDQYEGVHVEDVSSTETTARLMTLEVDRPLSGDVSGEIMALACGEYGVRVYDVSEPRSPQLLGIVRLPYAESAAIYREEWIFAACGLDGIAVIRLDGEGRPSLHRFHQAFPGYYALKLAVSDPWLYALYPRAGFVCLRPSVLIDPGRPDAAGGFQLY